MRTKGIYSPQVSCMWMISIAHESTYRGAVSRKFLEIDQEKRISILPMEKHTITGKHWGSVEICSVVFHLAKKRS